MSNTSAFKPKKVQEGTKQWQLKQYAQQTLVSAAYLSNEIYRLTACRAQVTCAPRSSFQMARTCRSGLQFTVSVEVQK